MGTTPTYGLPYPELGDPPNGPAAFQQLAEGTETELDRIETGHDGRLTTLEDRVGEGLRFTASPTHTAFTGTIEVRDIANGVVTMTGYLDVDTDIGTGFVDTGITIPADYWPDFSGGAVILFVTNYYNSSHQFRYRITTDGSLEFQQTGVDSTFATVATTWTKAEA